MKNIIGFALVGASFFAAADPQVILTSGTGSKESTVIGLDVVSDKNVKAFMFDVDVTGAKSVDLSACTSGLALKVVASCVHNGNKVRVLIVDTTFGSEMAAGKISIGSIKVGGSIKPTLFNVEFASNEGEVMPSSSVISN